MKTQDQPQTDNTLRRDHLINSQRVRIERAIVYSKNGDQDKAVKAMNECLEILRLIKALPQE